MVFHVYSHPSPNMKTRAGVSFCKKQEKTPSFKAAVIAAVPYIPHPKERVVTYDAFFALKLICIHLSSTIKKPTKIANRKQDLKYAYVQRILETTAIK